MREKGYVIERSLALVISHVTAADRLPVAMLCCRHLSVCLVRCSCWRTRRPCRLYYNLA